MRCRGRYTLLSILLASHIQTATSIPQSLSRRQDSFSGLQLPQCALTCFVTGILTDGCANEADFACHCRNGNIIEKAAACVKQGCGAKDGSDAMRKLGAACNAVGGDSGGGGGVDESRNRDGTSSTVNPLSTATSSPSLSTPGPAPSQQPSPGPNNSNNNSQSPSSSTPSSSSPQSPTTPSSPTMSPTQPPTDMPLAPLPPSDQLSDGAKAGIAVSVSLIALSIFFALGWYIRRLKRDLAAAQALVSTSEPPWPPVETIFSPTTGTFAITRAESSRGRRSPVSPLSSPPMIISDNGYGVLKKKRGNVLSIVVEDDEDRSSLVPSRGNGVREPVPGQREGLVDPLELDGVWTGLVEAPLAVTPRERSRERT